MLSITEREFISYLKNTERITIKIINEVRAAIFLKYKYTTFKEKLLDLQPRTFDTIQKIDEIYEDLEFYETLLGYWTLRKIKEELPNFNYYLPEEEPETVNYNIIKKMERTFLVGKTKVIDIISIDNDITVVKKSGRVVNPSGQIGLKNIEGLNLTETLCQIINEILDERNERQRIKCEPGTRTKHITSEEVRVYCNWYILGAYYDSVPEIKKLWIVNPKKTVGLYNVTEDGTFKENKDFDSIVNNEQKRKNEQLALTRRNKKSKK
ncbi:MAG: hypothetical protein IJA94_02190 [Bacilli bacterium]|nr:hypothetical protein [Bacilli bacterium]